MSDWLDPLRAALDDAPSPVVFFFRDDDAGRRDDRLHRLLDVFEVAEVPIDLAAIPRAVSRGLARRLAARRRTAPIGVHQHGFAHVNHERTGRKSEFGPARPMDIQLADVLRGRRLLLARFEGELDPIFTPPWNRCTSDTARAVRSAGLSILSRESRAEPLACDGLAELPVSVDWLRRCHGVQTTRAELGDALAGAARTGSPAGVMLHHAVMNGDDRANVAQLLALLGASPSARVASMPALAAGAVAT